MRKILFVFVLSLLLAACTPTAASNIDIADRRVQVTTTTGMIADLVHNVGGERVEVNGLMGPGVDPHLYKASESDVRLLENADIIFYNGLHLEAAMANVLEQLGKRQPVVAVSDGIPRDQLLGSLVYANTFDPHIWFDVALWMQTVDTVRQALSDLDPTHADIYAANAAAYLDVLEQLHSELQSLAGTLQPQQRVLITAHDAFSYFGRAYGFEVAGLQGISTADEASAADVTDLVDFIIDRQVPAIFVETSVPQRTIEAVQAAVAARGATVRLGEALFSDAMGAPDTPEGEYTGMLRHNMRTIVEGLSQSTP